MVPLPESVSAAKTDGPVTTKLSVPVSVPKSTSTVGTVRVTGVGGLKSAVLLPIPIAPTLATGPVKWTVVPRRSGFPHPR